jgi:hypothetical protein
VELINRSKQWVDPSALVLLALFIDLFITIFYCNISQKKRAHYGYIIYYYSIIGLVLLLLHFYFLFQVPPTAQEHKKRVPFSPFVHKKTEAQNSYFSVEIEPSPPFFLGFLMKFARVSSSSSSFF